MIVSTLLAEEHWTGSTLPQEELTHMPGAWGDAICKKACPRESEMDHEKIE